MSIKIGISIRPHAITSSPVYVYEPETTTYFSGLVTPPSNSHRLLVDTFVKYLKTNLGITSLTDIFNQILILAGQTQEMSLRNLVKNQYHGAANSSFTAYEGFQGDGIATYLTTNWNPTADPGRYALDDCSFGCYVRNDVDTGATLGTLEANQSIIFAKFGGNLYWTNGGAAASAPNADSRGMIIASRIAPTENKCYQNGLLFGTDGSAHAMIPTIDFWIGCRNFGGSYNLGSTHQVAFWFAGRGLSQAEAVVVTNAFEAYMDANGKGVIP